MGVLDRAAEHEGEGRGLRLATVVRTVSVTAAKAGAKALITPDGAIEEGWIGGGCARAAVVKAARQCLLDGRSRLVSIAPQEGLDELGVAPGEDSDGVLFAKNACPSQGTMDIFVEPVLPKPQAPHPRRLARRGRAGEARARLSVSRSRSPRRRPSSSRFPEGRRQARRSRAVDGGGGRGLCRRLDPRRGRPRRAEGGRRDARALPRLRRLPAQGRDAEAGARRRGRVRRSLARVKAPAGLDISAITSEEIALSILAEMTAVRRRPERPDLPSDSPQGAA